MGARLNRHLRGVWIVALTSCISACEESLDPLQSTEMAYSIHGHLDAAADTQWIRVAGFRSSIFSTPDPVDAEVSIEDLASGRVIELVPTLFRQGSGNFDDSLFAYNFRTAEPIQYGATFRLTARRSDGTVSTTTVQTPEDVSHLTTRLGVYQLNFPPRLDSIHFPVADGDFVAMIHTIHYPPERSTGGANPHACSHFAPTYIHHSPVGYPVSGPDYRRGTLYKIENMDFCGDQPFEYREVRIIRTHEAWPFAGTSDYTHANTYTNIQNGVGFLGGVSTTVLPYPDCELSGPGRPAFCNLYFGPETATLVINVFDGTPEAEREDPLTFIPDLSLRRGEESWTRSVRSSPSWQVGSPQTYRFEGLLPGPYHIAIDDLFTGSQRLYCEERSLELESGERHISITMVRVSDFYPNEPLNANGCREGL